MPDKGMHSPRVGLRRAVLICKTACAAYDVVAVGEREYLSFSRGALVCLVPAHINVSSKQDLLQQSTKLNTTTITIKLRAINSGSFHLFLPINHLHKISPTWVAAHRGKTTSQATLAHHRPLATLSTTSGLAINITESNTCATRSEPRRSEAGRMASSPPWLVLAKTRSTQHL